METNIISKISFFDFMRCFFTDKAKYAKLTQSAKKPHVFMFKRMMAIMYPVQMNAISSVDDVRLIDALHKVFCKGTYPKWMYTSTSGEAKEAKSKLIHKTYSRDVLDAFMEQYKIDYKTVLDLESMSPEFLKNELNSFEEELHPKYSKKNK